MHIHTRIHADREILQFMQEHPELAHTPLIRIGNNPKKGWDEFVLDPINWNVLSLKISGLLLRIAAVKNKRILRLKQENFLTIINPHRQVDELDLLTQKDYVKPSKCHVLIAVCTYVCVDACVDACTHV